MRIAVKSIVFCFAQLISLVLFAQDYETERLMNRPYHGTKQLSAALKNPSGAMHVFIDNYSDSIFPSEDISKLTTTVYLVVRARFNYLKGDTSYHAPLRIKIDTARLKRMTNLRCLEFENFDFSVFPEEIFCLDQLKGLACAMCLIKSIPPSVKRLRSLTCLELRINSLTELPPALFEMDQLEVLDLGNNLFKRIPEDILKITALRELNMANIESSKPLNFSSRKDPWVFPVNINTIDYLGQYDLMKRIIIPDKFERFYMSAAKGDLLEQLKGKLKEDGLIKAVSFY